MFAQHFAAGKPRDGTAAEIAAARRVLDGTVLEHADPDDGYLALRLADGAGFGFASKGLVDGAGTFDGFHCDHFPLTRPKTTWLYDLLAASGCVAYTPGEPVPFLITHERQRADLPAEVRTGEGFAVSLVRNGEDVAAALADAAGTAEAYRHAVVGRRGKSSDPSP